MRLWTTQKSLVSGDYQVAVCIETDGQLAVILIGPPLRRHEQPPPMGIDAMSVTARLPDGTVLTTKGYSGRPSADNDLVIVEFEPPPSGTEALEIRFTPTAQPGLEAPAELVATVHPMQ